MKLAEITDIDEFVKTHQKILVVQADNPDGDSLASALALEEILSELGKDVYLYCGVDLPSYLHYFPGSDRVTSEVPNDFEASIIVDTSSDSLLEQLRLKSQRSWLAAKPSLIVDHHATAPTIDFAELAYVKPAVATCELIYEIAKGLNWPLTQQAKEFIAMGILSDSLGLTSEATTARSIHIIAELVEGGVSLAELENARRETMRRETELIHYKGRLLERVEFYSDNRIATVTIPWEEIERYSPLYNPPMLVIDDMRLAKDTDVAICFKVYRDGKITGKIRCNYGKGIGDKLAEHFGGGGHPYAAGFKLTDGRNFEDVKSECIQVATKLLDELGGDKS
ncbi:MAG TPA: DHH family phosphoesterase [Candidatus Saccharimonadales bacterium]|nr:DHH family phosphoesterase [Candidatus Saccharimonadales bacterium]